MSLPGPDEEREYFIGRSLMAPLKVLIRGIPPCLWCGRPVTCPSMDGPLVCAACDMGVDGETGRRWTAQDYNIRSQHFAESINKYTEEERKREGDKRESKRAERRKTD